MAENIDEIKDESESFSDDSLFNITSFGADLSFRELITMYDEGDLEKPELQRHYVWEKKKQVDLLSLFYWDFLYQVFS